MKKLVILGAASIIMGTFANASSAWTCYRYVDGGPTGGFVKVYANSEEEATKKATKKYEKLGYRFDYVKCK